MNEHIAISMGMDIAALRKGMDAANALVSRTMTVMKRSVLAAAGVVGVAFGFHEIGEGIGGAVKRGKELDSLARESGRTAEEIALLTETVYRSQIGMSDAADIAQTLAEHWRNSAIGVTDFSHRLKILGLTTEQLAKMSIPEQFDAIATKINEIRDPVVRAQLAMDLFGASGKKAVANYQSGDLAHAANLMGKNALRLAEASKWMARLNDAWSRIKKAGEVFFGAIASKVAPMLSVAADKLEGILPVIDEWAVKVGTFLVNTAAVILQAFKEGKMVQFLKLGLVAAVKTAGNALLLTMASSIAFMREGLKAIWTALGNYMSERISATWELSKALMLSAAEAMVKAIWDGMAEVAIFFSEKVTDVIKPIIEFFGGETDRAFIGKIREAQAGGDKKIEGFFDASKAHDAAIDHAEKAKLAWEKIDWSGAFKKAVEAFRGQMRRDPFGSKEAWEQFQKFSSGMLKNFKMPKLPESAKRPGEGGKGPLVRAGFGGEGIYDEFRRVGGGVAAGVTNIQQRMYDKLNEIALKNGEQIVLLQQVVDRATGGHGSLELGGVR